jgi:tetratricopeptide (TPR) repeat protein
VDRLDAGRAWRGRPIPALSYAWYARGAHLEARGQLEQAEAAYVEAAQLDPESGALWARVGALRCLRGATGTTSAFKRAWETNNDRTAVLVARGQCALRSRRPADAEADGRAAVARAPRSIDANLLVVDALVAQGKEDEGVRWLDALAAYLPGARRVQTRRIAEARLRNDTSRERRARELHAPPLHVELIDAPPSDPELDARGRAALDAALALEDVERALRRGTTLGLRPAELALRAIALGRPALAEELARFVLAADPADAEARIALLAARDLQTTPFAEPVAPPSTAGAGAPAPVGTTAGTAGPPDPLNADLVWSGDVRSGGELGPLAVLLFAELLERRAGPAAAELWRKAHPAEPTTDPLVESVRGRGGSESVGLGLAPQRSNP